jgi:UDPglucose 6-dehydrogenase
MRSAESAWPALGRPTGIKVCVIGTGYVGLTVGAGLAYLGHEVICTDASPARVEALWLGEIPILEAGLPEVVALAQQAGRLSFGTDNVAAARDADFVFLCVPTPQGLGGGADLRHVREVATQVGPFLRPGAIVVNKSTVPVGTGESVARTIGRDDVFVVSNPEFLAEGSAVDDFFAPDRVVTGSDNRSAANRVAQLYATLESEVILTDLRSAEMIKYAANAYLATRLSFVNSMAALCEATGADISAVTKGMGSDHRIGRAFLRPGPGWGGSCFPKDTRALIRIAADHGADLPLVEAAVRVNEQRRQSIVGRVVRAIPDDLRDARVAMWGLTYKAGTDDLRDSPAVAIANELSSAGLLVQAYDPGARQAPEGVTVCESALAACRDADVLVIGTEWPEFAAVDLEQVRLAMAGDVVIDTRNLLDGEAVTAAGLRYSCMGVADEIPALAEFAEAG